MNSLLLPRLAGTRELVGDLLREQELPDSLSGCPLVVYARDLSSGSSSFADQLVCEGVLDRGASEILLVGAPPAFAERVKAAARRRGVGPRVREVAADQLPPMPATSAR